MSRSTKLAKCPRCLPDAKGAVFSASYARDERDEHEDLVPVWTCNNCGFEKPRTSRPAPTAEHRTRQQQAWLDRIATDFGGTIAVDRVGRSTLWISAKNDDRNFIQDGTMLYGSIGARGKVKLTLCRAILGDVEITDVRGWNDDAPVKAIRDARRAEEMARLDAWLRADDLRRGVKIFRENGATGATGGWRYEYRDGAEVAISAVAFETEHDARKAAWAKLDARKTAVAS